MKNLKTLCIILSLGLFFSCSKDDGPKPPVSETDPEPELQPYLSKVLYNGNIFKTYHYSQEMVLDSIVVYDTDTGETLYTATYQIDATGKITKSLAFFPHYTATTEITYENNKIKSIVTTKVFNNGTPSRTYSYNYSYPAEDEIYMEHHSEGSYSFSYRYFMDGNGDVQFAERRGGALNRDIAYLYDEGVSPAFLMSQHYKGLYSLAEPKHALRQEKIVDVDFGEEIIINYENEFNAKNWLVKKTETYTGGAEIEVYEYEYLIK